MAEAFDIAWDVVKGLTPFEEAAANEYSTAEDYSPMKRRKALGEMSPNQLHDGIHDPYGDLDMRYFDPHAIAASGGSIKDAVNEFGVDEVKDAYEQIMRIKPPQPLHEGGAKGNCNECGEVKSLLNYPNDDICEDCR
jgi:hypothetical protein